jgi:hypothetical protein
LADGVECFRFTLDIVAKPIMLKDASLADLHFDTLALAGLMLIAMLGAGRSSSRSGDKC